MAYTKTTWLEHSMSTAAKKTALDNLEGLYGQAVTYIDGITHSASYYTDAQAAGKFFTADTDGEGSNLVSETVDGHTISDISSYGIPTGVIAIWSGALAAIPAGWYLCDGNNSTPDLRNKFIVAAGSAYNLADNAAVETDTPEASAVSIGTTVLDGTHLPSHTHTYDDYYRANTNNSNGATCKPTADHASLTTDAATSTAHGHTGSTFTGIETSILPPYMVLCFIMKA
jgi:hypothetical protein